MLYGLIVLIGDTISLMISDISEQSVIAAMVACGIALTLYLLRRGESWTQWIFSLAYFPILFTIFIYLWFLVGGVSIADRAQMVRLAFLQWGSSFSIIFLSLAIINYKNG